MWGEKSEVVKVLVGQVWRDLDERSGTERWLTITAVDVKSRRATCSTMVRVRGIEGAPLKPGRSTRVRLDRLRPSSTGYKLVSDVGSLE